MNDMLPTTLIVQGTRADPAHLRELATLCGATAVRPVREQVFELTDIRHPTNVSIYCERLNLDFAFLPPARKLTDYRLVAMDMDSTVITIECIDELADLAGCKSEVTAITTAAMHGEIDFVESLRRRVALLAGLNTSALEEVYDERLKLTPGVETLLRTMQAAGLKTLLITAGFSYFAERLRTRLALDFVAANKLEIVDDRLTGKLLEPIIGAADKAAWLNRVRQDLGLTKEQTIAIGDGANDLEMMAQSGVSIAYRAKPVVRAQATHALNHCYLDGALNLFR